MHIHTHSLTYTDAFGNLFVWEILQQSTASKGWFRVWTQNWASDLKRRSLFSALCLYTRKTGMWPSRGQKSTQVFYPRYVYLLLYFYYFKIFPCIHGTGFVDVGNRTVEHPDGTKSGDWRQALIEVRACILLIYVWINTCVCAFVCVRAYIQCMCV